MAEMDSSDAVAWLMARAELHDLNMKFSRAVDRGDIELLKSVYHSDSTDDHGFWSGTGWGFADFIIPLMRERFASSHHFIGNERYVIDGERAEGEVSVTTLKSPKSEPRKAALTSARYLDRYERRDNVWRIAHRLAIADVWDSQEFGEIQVSAWGENAYPLASYDSSDPSLEYELIAT
jgi:hypothetical protein